VGFFTIGLGSYCVLECYIAINAGNKPFQAFAHLFRMAYLSRFLVSRLKRNKSQVIFVKQKILLSLTKSIAL
jgi:hypothetical protein